MSDRAVRRRPTEVLSRWRVRPWPYFGGLALTCLVLQGLTGLFMTFSYQPTPDRAYVSVYYLANVMPYGWLIRTIHVWGAHLTIVFTALHALRMFLTASYKHPRQVSWVLGAVALGAVLALAFAGALLPWDQKAYWGTTAAISLFRETPLIGEWVAGALLGGARLGATALTRFHAAHVTVLPAALAGALVAHLLTARKHSLTFGPARATSPDDAENTSADETVPFYPDQMMTAATNIVLLLSLYAALAILVPAVLDLKADPLATLVSARPPWYLASITALTRIVPAWLALTLAAALSATLVTMPFLDRSPAHAPANRRLAIVLGSSAAIGVAVLTAVGALL